MRGAQPVCSSRHQGEALTHSPTRCPDLQIAEPSAAALPVPHSRVHAQVQA